MYRFVVSAAAVAAAALPATALAAPASLPAVKRSLTAKSASAGSCAVQRPGGRGVSRTAYRAPMSGFLRATLRAPDTSDWDLAVYDRAGQRRLATSESFGSHEVAETWVTAGQPLAIQGCLRKGRARHAALALRLFDIRPPRTDGIAKLVTVLGSQKQIARLEALGLDVTHDEIPGQAEVAVYSAQQLKTLEATGLKTQVKIADLTADSARARAADARAAAAGPSPLPSGRSTYRVLADYQNELKKLASDYRSLVKPVTIGKSVEGRSIDGVEISGNVGASDDGKPTFFLVGIHHAREWPAGEAAMEFAWTLAKGYGSDPRVTKLLDSERVVIVPIANPDGFVVSRTDSAFSPNDQGNENGFFTPGEDPGETVHTGEAVAPGGPPAAYRRKNCTGSFPAGFPCEFQYGVDMNRNYGNGWGGPGASTDPSSQTYRGTGPWSEPEVNAFWKYFQKRNITNIISLHNVAALVLRPPGLASAGFAPDEPRMKQIGDAMADATGYTSQFSWQLYDTSGTTEDWNYAQQSSYGYTIEIGPQGGQFHMPYQQGVVNEWTGGGKRPGLREALMIGAEAAANPADHSQITGHAPAGRVLRLHKTFKTATGDRGQICGFADPSVLSGVCESQEPATQVPDMLDYTTRVPSSGQYDWHVSPSTRPFVAEHWELGELKTLSQKKWDGNMPADGSDEVIPVTLTDADLANVFQTSILLEWDPANAFDLDLYIEWKDPVTGEWRQVGSSGGFVGQEEQVDLIQPRSGDYRIRIVNFLAPPAEPYHVTLTNSSGSIKVTKSGKTEAYTMTCETPDGKVLETKPVTVGRGQTVGVDFACDGSSSGDGTYAGAQTGSGAGGGQLVLGAKARSGRLVISKRKVRLTKRGFVPVRVLCTKAGPCKGTLGIRTLRRYAKASRKARRSFVAIGRKGYALRPGRRATLKVKASKQARRLIRKHRKRGVRVLAGSGTSRAKFTVLPASRR